MKLRIPRKLKKQLKREEEKWENELIIAAHESIKLYGTISWEDLEKELNSDAESN